MIRVPTDDEIDAAREVAGFGVTWICQACGAEFTTFTISHAVHHPSCDGSCVSCPVECGPVEEVAR